MTEINYLIENIRNGKNLNVRQFDDLYLKKEI